MTVTLTEVQAAYLRGDHKNGRPHGLVRKGCLRHRWGSDPSMGYIVTDLGARSLAAHDTRTSTPAS